MYTIPLIEDEPPKVLPLWCGDPAAIELAFRLAAERPVEFGAFEIGKHSCGDSQRKTGVLLSSLNQ